MEEVEIKVLGFDFDLVELGESERKFLPGGSERE